jgi:signal peptidase II
VILVIIIWLSLEVKVLEKICYSMILGGGFGNLFDRLYYGSVIDFIDLNYKSFHWFIFNVADMFITTGVIILIY